MIFYGHGTAGYVLTFISLIAGLFADIVSIIVLIILNYHRLHHRLKRDEKITLILSMNIYLVICLCITALIITNIQTLLGDMYGYSFDSPWCIFEIFFIFVMCCAMYLGFLCQSLYRLCRIVYPNYRWLQSHNFYTITVPIQIIIGALTLCPLLIRQDIIYHPQEHYCILSIFNSFSMFWALAGCYGIPISCISIVYIRIVIFIRKQSNNLTLLVQRRQQRDILAVKHILININILIVVATPGLIVYIYSLIVGVEYFLTHRIIWIGAELAVAILTVEMVWMTPQLRNVIMNQWQPNRVNAVIDSIRIRPVATA